MYLQLGQLRPLSQSLGRLQAFKMSLKGSPSSPHQVSSWTVFSNTTRSTLQKYSERMLASVVRRGMQLLPTPQSWHVDHGLSWSSKNVAWEKLWPSVTPLPNRFSAQVASQSFASGRDEEVQIYLELELYPRSILRHVFAKAINSRTSSTTSGS